MVNPTEGTYTFLFTDIEGSTRLLQRLGNDYPQVIEQHNRLIREAVAKAGASEVDNAGDGFFFVFPTTSQALEAAVEAQRSLADYKWPRGGSIHVRMGIHTGEAVFSGGKDRKSTRLNSSHGYISYAVFCVEKNPGEASTFAAGGRPWFPPLRQSLPPVC